MISKPTIFIKMKLFAAATSLVEDVDRHICERMRRRDRFGNPRECRVHFERTPVGAQATGLETISLDEHQ